MNWKLALHMLIAAVVVGMFTTAIADETSPTTNTTWGGVKVIYLDPPSPNVTAPSTVARPGAQPNAMSYPAWYKELPVPWVTQFLRGSTDAGTKTCGPACVVMIDSYFRHVTPTEVMIWNALEFLNWRFPGRGYYSANSKPTYFTNDNTLGTLISQRYGYAYAAQQAPGDADLSRAFRAINAGFPVIVSVMEDGGVPVGYNSGIYHWVVLVGFNQGNGSEVIVNDPGTHYAFKGNKRHIPMATFLASWRISGRWWVVVENGNICIPF